MKIHELITQLKLLNPNLEVYVPSKLTEFEFCVAHTAKPKFLTIDESEEYPDETLVFCIDEC